MGNVQTIQPTPSYIKIPASYPKIPTPGKIQILFTANKGKLWHKLSPYTDYDSSTLLNKVFSDTEPFYYVYADQETGLNALRRYQSTVFPIGSAPIDVIRVSKFLISGRGIGFLATQFLLQRANAFNETRIYNPTSPIMAAGMTLAFSQVRPQRHIDTSGLAGIAGSLLGNVGSAIFGAPKNDPPTGTVGAGALPWQGQNSGKGLLRFGTANTAKSLLELKWPITSGNSSGGGLGGLLSTISGLAQGLVDNFITPKQKDIQKRSDEGTYGRMIAAGSNPTIDGIRFGYYGNSQYFSFLQRWVGGGKTSRKNNEYPATAGRLFINNDKTPNIKRGKTFKTTLSTGGVNLPVGYVVRESTIASKPGYRYGDTYGKEEKEDKNGIYGSDIMVQFEEYSSTGAGYNFPTKKTDAASVEYINAQLQKILVTIPKIGNGNIYTINIPKDSKAITGPDNSLDGYNQLFTTTQGQDKVRGISPMVYPNGLMMDYSFTRTVDESIKPKGITDGHATYKLPTNGTFDAINTLEVLDDNKTIKNSKLTKWKTWEPYKDDLIALYFYDVVNKKYIPFRASIKGLTESGNATWEELPFIGRADKVYSYGGFNRNLSLNIKIVIGSIVELQPTWQRVNYMATSIKPSNYTSAAGGQTTDRFVVPPMFFLTVGDMYKDQPVLIQSITVTIPDDAAWETLNEDNSGDWSYLVNYIKAVNSYGSLAKVPFAQVPREVDLGFSLILLEKERAIIGGANFGHAPRLTDSNRNWLNYNIETPLAKWPTKWSRDLVVDVTK